MEEEQTPVSSEELRKRCIEMKAGEEFRVTLDHDPQPGELSSLNGKITVDRLSAKKRGTISIRSSERHINVHCY